jgi:hypothetical protein
VFDHAIEKTLARIRDGNGAGSTASSTASCTSHSRFIDRR